MRVLVFSTVGAALLAACATQAPADAPVSTASAAPQDVQAEEHVRVVRVEKGEWTPAPGAPGAPPAPPAPPKVKIEGDAVFFEGRQIAKLDDHGKTDTTFTTADGQQGRVTVHRLEKEGAVSENVKLFITDEDEVVDLSNVEDDAKVMVFKTPDGRTIELLGEDVVIDGEPVETDTDMTWIEKSEDGQEKVIVIKKKVETSVTTSE